MKSLKNKHILFKLIIFIFAFAYLVAYQFPGVPEKVRAVVGTLNIQGNATNICTLVAYTGGSGTVSCPAGFYTWSAVGLTSGHMMCCRVNNPI